MLISIDYSMQMSAKIAEYIIRLYIWAQPISHKTAKQKMHVRNALTCSRKGLRQKTVSKMHVQFISDVLKYLHESELGF
jgi:hypothetical protein